MEKWKLGEQEFTEDMISDNVGFVYFIINTTKKKAYIGKKLFTKSKTYQKNKKKKRTRIKSDWESYTGSNKQLNEDIMNGDKYYKFIYMLCKTKGWCSYWETKTIMDFNALIDTNYYNDWVSCRIRRIHLK